MYGGDYGDLLYRTASGGIPQESWKAEFGVSTRLSIPPYPTEMRMPKMQGIPIKGIDPEDVEQIQQCYLYDVKLEKGKLVTAGINGLIACPVAIGTTPVEAFDLLENRVKSIQIPDMQYRDDLKKSLQKRYYELEQKGWF
jgi:phosphoribosylamine-glycine ligase